MSSTYQPKNIEQTCYQRWENSHSFKPQGNGKPYCIMIPPPNVTGSLHMGHAFQQTLMDILIRYHRMKGDKTLWQVGTDHAGIATQMMVERQLAKEGLTKQDLGRDEFTERVWQWKRQSGYIITHQMRRLGISVDWSSERFTMDPDLSIAVQEVFIKLYQEGLIYRGQRLVNWDPHFRSALSDLEVISTEEQGNLYYIRYLLENNSGFITVATTRPETLFGDVAIAVHPDDERFKTLIGLNALLPISGRPIPIIADEQVAPEFGTGCVKITPAHDFNDYAMGQRHRLPIINIMTESAHLNENVPKTYQGLERFEARKQLIEELKQKDLLEKIEPHILNIPRAERGNTIIEPYLTWQWFVKADILAEAAKEVVSSGEIQFIPEHWQKTYFQWMNNIQDWCISRQLWWGHRIPAWYDEQGKYYVGRNENEIRQQYGIEPNISLFQDPDVLDTWFSSALWPFATLGWPKQTEALETFYPTAVLVTGFDIIFFWVARMIMMGVKLTGKIPFHEVYIHGLIRDSEGQKMSKTKGNVLDPLDLIDGISLDKLLEKRMSGLLESQAKKIEKSTRKEFPNGIAAYGTDALRLTFALLATTGRDIRFDMNRLEGSRNFCNKLWNAARFVHMQVERHKTRALSTNEKLHSVNHYFIQALADLVVNCETELKNYRFDLMAQALYDFVWNQFCDWQIELSKIILQSESYSNEEKIQTCSTLVFTLDMLLRLMHPIMPFITEELWQNLKKYSGALDETIMLTAYPNAENIRNYIKNDGTNLEIENLKPLITSIRTLRSELNVSPGEKLPLYYAKGSMTEQNIITKYSEFIMGLARLKSFTPLNSNIQTQGMVQCFWGELELWLGLETKIDINAERERISKDQQKIMIELEKLLQRLNNPNFVQQAPAKVVEKDQARATELKQMVNQLEEKLQKL